MPGNTIAANAEEGMRFLRYRYPLPLDSVDEHVARVGRLPPGRGAWGAHGELRRAGTAGGWHGTDAVDGHQLRLSRERRSPAFTHKRLMPGVRPMCRSRSHKMYALGLAVDAGVPHREGAHQGCASRSRHAANRTVADRTVGCVGEVELVSEEHRRHRRTGSRRQPDGGGCFASQSALITTYSSAARCSLPCPSGA